jgi:uncharacterized surface protein with fasciclin (FAS1) repeats
MAVMQLTRAIFIVRSCFWRCFMTLSPLFLRACRVLALLGCLSCLMPAALAGAAPGAPAVAPGASVLAVLAQQPDLHTFVQLLKEAGLAERLDGGSGVTVFAPTDEAFLAMPAATLDHLAHDLAWRRKWLQAHIVAGRWRTQDVSTPELVPSANGTHPLLARAGNTLTIDDAMVTRADLPARNGVVHVIDQTLSPAKQ